MLTVKFNNTIPKRNSQTKDFFQNQNRNPNYSQYQNRNPNYSQFYHNSLPASNDFICPRCKKKAYLFEQHKNHAKVVCLKHGSQLVWTRQVGGQGDV